MRNSNYATENDAIKLHFFKDTHWVANIEENFSDSYGFLPPKRNLILSVKRMEKRFFFECKIQRIGKFWLFIVFNFLPNLGKRFQIGWIMFAL